MSEEKVDPSKIPSGEDMEHDGDFGTADPHSGHHKPGEAPSGEAMEDDGDFGTPGNDEGFEREEPEFG